MTLWFLVIVNPSFSTDYSIARQHNLHKDENHAIIKRLTKSENNEVKEIAKGKEAGNHPEIPGPRRRHWLHRGANRHPHRKDQRFDCPHEDQQA